jgi:hypothetical protein
MSTEPELRAAIAPHLDGGTMQHAGVVVAAHPANMFIDDLGIPRACRATRRPRRSTERIGRASTRKRTPERLTYIVGPVVIFDEIVWS